ncbi:MAG: hypothetical protein PF503_22865 [Desulfobacula sp.]|jgi:hypothetical protein|nr:hypothetical protein [Desulfobacula sp.]
MRNIPLDHIADEECLHRRVNPTFVKDSGEVSSQAFTDTNMSVDRGHYLDVEQSLLNNDGYGLVGFYAEVARALNQLVEADPIAENMAHALVKGKKTKSIKRKLAKQSNWVVPI